MVFPLNIFWENVSFEPKLFLNKKPISLDSSQNHRTNKLNSTFFLFHFLLTDIFAGSPYNDKQLEKQQQYPYQANAEVPLSSSDYSSDVWFKVATIAVPICGAVILFVLIALAIRILKNDSIDSPKLNSCGGNRKPPVDYEAYGAHEQNIKESPLLKHSIYGDGASICHNDLKNENLAKKNQLMSLEYSLLPQSCHDPSHKPTNTEVGSACLYRNINLSLNPTAKSRDLNDKKVYEKEVLSPASYWTGNYGG